MSTAIIAVDPQNDFCSHGALAVPHGETIMPPLNRLLTAFTCRIITQDWHPSDHMSFADNHPGKEPFSSIPTHYGTQILWPRHCVQGTPGADFHPEIDTASANLIIRKGFHPNIDSYSAFYENDHRTATGLAGYLRDRGIRHIVLAGLAFDFCVLWSARDARKLGFEVTVAEDACRAIDLNGSKKVASDEMRALGCQLASTAEILRSMAP